MKVGDLVKVKTRRKGTKLAIIVDNHFSSIGVEWVVQPVDCSRQVVCAGVDLEVISETKK